MSHIVKMFTMWDIVNLVLEEEIAKVLGNYKKARLIILLTLSEKLANLQLLAHFTNNGQNFILLLYK